MKVEDLKFDKRNYRRHSEKNQDLIKKSINEVGFGRSIVIDADNEIVCGNGVVSQIAKSTPIKVVETNGSELVVVKRTDLKTDDEKRKQLAVMDNSTSDSSDFDLTLLQEDFDTEELEDWGINLDFNSEEESEVTEIGSVLEELNDLRGLIYEPTGEKPKISELYSGSDKIENYKKKIEDSKLNNDEKEFCLKALTRFYRFNFKNIAEYYSHASDECKKIFEDLILVIPDGKKILRNELLDLDKTIIENEGIEEDE
jgi:hypothetical protein